VKLYFDNSHTQVFADRSPDLRARRGAAGYGGFRSGLNGGLWSLRSTAEGPDSPRSISSDSCTSNVQGFSRRGSLKVEETTGWLRIDGITELGQSEAQVLLAKVNSALTNKVKTIVIDLSQADFLDSQGLGFLIALRNIMVRRKGVVRLLNPSRLVEQVLELTRLHRVLDIVKCEASPAS